MHFKRKESPSLVREINPVHPRKILASCSKNILPSFSQLIKNKSKRIQPIRLTHVYNSNPNFMSEKPALPPGQKASEIFPRFGLPQYANRFPKVIDEIKITIGGDFQEFKIGEELKMLPRIEQTSDFHCVTTWSKLGLNWSGWKFSDLYEQLIEPKLTEPLDFVVMKTQDGFVTSLPLEDLLKPNVLLADSLNGKPLTIEHDAPVRIVAPDHYGYKNPKHLDSIFFYREAFATKKGIWQFIDHPRARVSEEERARKGPGLLYRFLYRFGRRGTIKDFEKAMKEYREKNQ